MLTCQIAAVTPARNSLRPGRESCDRPGHSARGRLGESLITRGTVCCETPARRATSAITTDLSGRRTTSVALGLAVRAEGAVALNQMASPAAGVGEEMTLKGQRNLTPRDEERPRSRPPRADQPLAGPPRRLLGYS
jgi:hypothetical protein